jgi:Na+-translocating ferredoxin:NAD+ oxidoreductase RnfC subunit
LQSRALSPSRLTLPLKQSAGIAVRPIVKAGDLVTAGQLLGDVAEKELGAALHAPRAAIVTEITPQNLVLTLT